MTLWAFWVMDYVKLTPKVAMTFVVIKQDTTDHKCLRGLRDREVGQGKIWPCDLFRS